MDRLTQISAQTSPNKTSATAVQRISQKSPDDVVITAVYRTALTKGRKGGFKDTSSAEILAGLLKGLIRKSGIDPSLIEDFVVGNCLNVGSGAT